MIMKNKIRFTFILSVVLFSSAMLFAEDNLIKNPSFEDVVNGKPSFWDETGWKVDPARTTYGIDTANPHSGKNSAMLINKQENHSYYTQVVTVAENSTYKLSAFIKTDKVGKETIGGTIGVKDRLEIGGDVRETSAWKPAELYIRTGSGITSFTVLLALGWYASVNTGTAWFDDVSLIQVSSIPDGAVICKVQTEPAKNEQPKQDNTAQQQNPRAQGGMIFFFILGGIVVLAGILFFVLVIAKKKDDKVPSEKKADESQPGEDKKQE
jgi:hypothetical protein